MPETTTVSPSMGPPQRALVSKSWKLSREEKSRRTNLNHSLLNRGVF